MNKSLRHELKKILIIVLTAFFSVLAIFTYLDSRERQIFNSMTERNRILNELYHTMESMENNLTLYMRGEEKVYYQ